MFALFVLKLEQFVLKLELFVLELELFVLELELFVLELELFVLKLELFVPKLELFVLKLELFVPELELFDPFSVGSESVIFGSIVPVVTVWLADAGCFVLKVCVGNVVATVRQQSVSRLVNSWSLS